MKTSIIVGDVMLSVPMPQCSMLFDWKTTRGLLSPTLRNIKPPPSLRVIDVRSIRCSLPGPVWTQNIDRTFSVVGLYHDGHSNENVKTNGVLVRNRQIHGEFTVIPSSENTFVVVIVKAQLRYAAHKGARRKFSRSKTSSRSISNRIQRVRSD